ncbi:energy-coupling factor ABC transporter ATP-binding protein [Heliorestis convoluta]|uniref:ABC-type cobalt transport system, ATPase component n=1 Tax=Heliorestis convoluta TaxID=356322 RepID=A0A5Q2MWY1_9FIRM|nr:ABC transporter ATP-binding protein [Heliorestis convoluta]QGG46241.1 ABC-type cobalt transport system, ATPase component [Heliorestis convoluta]
MEAALIIKNLSFRYEEERSILHDLHLTLAAGERVGLIGPNGAGKTTLFLLLGAILKPTKGSVSLFDKAVLPGAFYPELGMVFQNTNDQLFCPSVREDIAFGPMNMGLSEKEVARRVEEASALTGIEGLLDRAPHHLSGGEKRMAAIAGIIAMGSRLLLLDEPSANLDMRYRRRLINLLQQRDCAMLLASHDLEMVLELCDRVLLLAEGAFQAEGAPREVLSEHSLLEKYGLEVPYSLRSCLNREHCPRDKAIR